MGLVSVVSEQDELWKRRGWELDYQTREGANPKRHGLSLTSGARYGLDAHHSPLLRS